MSGFVSLNRRMERPEILTEREVEQCFEYIDGMKKRGLKRAMVVDQVFRLSTVMGLRAAEIRDLKIKHVRVWEDKINFIRVIGGKWRKAGNAIGFKKDAIEDVAIPCLATLERFREQRSIRLQTAEPEEAFCVGVYGQPMVHRSTPWRFYRWALKCLPEDRQKELSTHNGRHTAISRVASRPDVSLATASDFARHRNMADTLRYLHGSDLVCTEMYQNREPEMDLDFSVERLTEELLNVIQETEPHVRSLERQVTDRLREAGLAPEFEKVRPRVMGLCYSLGIKRTERREVIVSRWAGQRFLGEDVYAGR